MNTHKVTLERSVQAVITVEVDEDELERGDSIREAALEIAAGIPTEDWDDFFSDGWDDILEIEEVA
jgi:hypothetical protein